MCLDVCIIAYRMVGLERIAAAAHPRIPGVRYIIAWQYADDSPEDVPAALSSRDDVVIIPNTTRGGGANRQVALDNAVAPLILLSDDDVEYLEEDILRLLQTFHDHPECAFLLMKCRSVAYPREYPDYEFRADQAPKGYFVGGPEIAFRREAIIEKKICFNPLFGRGAKFCAGEDALFVDRMIKSGLRGRFIPQFICSHEAESTGIRELTSPDFIRAKGAMFCHIHPKSWPARMITHALRLSKSLPASINYIRHWLKGVKDLHLSTH